MTFLLDHITKDAFGWMLLGAAFVTGIRMGWRAYRQIKSDTDNLETHVYGDVPHIEGRK